MSDRLTKWIDWTIESAEWFADATASRFPEWEVLKAAATAEADYIDPDPAWDYGPAVEDPWAAIRRDEDDAPRETDPMDATREAYLMEQTPDSARAKALWLAQHGQPVRETILRELMSSGKRRTRCVDLGMAEPPDYHAIALRKKREAERGHEAALSAEQSRWRRWFDEQAARAEASP